MATKKNPALGKWRITDMEMWDEADFALLGDAYVKIARGHHGELQFVCIRGNIDWRDEDGQLAFTWEGDDEGTPVCGRATASIEGNVMTGRIYIHLGDDSAFTAQRV